MSLNDLHDIFFALFYFAVVMGMTFCCASWQIDIKFSNYI